MVKTLKQFTEAKGKSIVMGFGRLNPPTVGHGQLLETMKKYAQKYSADHIMFLSKTQDAKKNPLDVQTKLKWAKKMFPGYNLVAANEKIRTFIEAVKSLDGKYETLYVVAGADRVSEYQKLLDTYNGREFNFSSAIVLSAGDRDPDADGVTGMSASKMRKAAAENDFSAFRSGIPRALKDADVKRLMNDVRRGMNITESIVGCTVRYKDSLVEVADVGTNYLTCITENGQLIRAFADQIEMTREQVQFNKYNDRWSYKGVALEVHEPTLIECLDRSASDPAVDVVGLIRAIRFLNEGNFDAFREQIIRIGELHNHSYLRESMKGPIVKPTDKLKVAKIIADAIGFQSDTSNPTELINGALRKLKTMPVRGEAINIMHRMLDKAEEVGVKFDRSLAPKRVRIDEVHTMPEYKDEIEAMGYEQLKKKLKDITGIENYGEQERGKTTKLKGVDGSEVKAPATPDGKNQSGEGLAPIIKRQGESLKGGEEGNTVRKMKVRRLKGLD